nr:phage tail fiber protein [uncultured Mediterranean phage uvMED]BAR38716.1 phage tail fiber protein [uncultured Mediterranean phage uvMED]
MSQVGDYNIANASGASVRSDLNAVFDAIKTLNSGGSDPSNTEAFMPYVDTADSNNLKIRNSSNNGFTTIGPVDTANLGLLPVAGGTMTGQFLADDGSGASSPAVSFDGDTDTGIYRSAANTMGFSTAGTQRVGISNAGLDMLNALPIRFQDSSGAPFVSLQSPSALSGNVALTLPASITNGGFLQTDGSGNLSFQIVAGVPTSAVFCVAVATVPTGYLECNGNAVNRTTYAALFAIIGTNYGTGDGSSTFNLPDLRGEFVRGFDNGKGTDSGRSIASSQSAQNASHNHSISASGTTSNKSLTGSVQRISETFNNSGSASGVFSKQTGFNTNFTPGSPDHNDAGAFSIDASHDHTVTVSGTSGSQGNEARPRNIAMMYIIKV